MESSEGLGGSGRPVGAWSRGQHCGHRTKGTVHYSTLRENIEGSRAENHKAELELSEGELGQPRGIERGKKGRREGIHKQGKRPS